jgi:hypothetical protein
MKMKLAATFASVLCLAVAGSALAAEQMAPKPIEIKDKISVQGTVTAIDHANRTVTIKGSQGNVLILTVDDSVTRFHAMKVGDTVKASYYESVAYDIKKPGTAAAPDKITQKSGKLTGAKPGGGVTDVNVTTVTITAIDPAVPSITVRGSDGQIQTFHVRHPEYLSQVKVGDVVVVTKTENLMVSVE